jgi:Icc-related predicted phosphoesterase
MKIQVLSDLHIDNWRHSSTVEKFLDECTTDADCLILAGDVVSLSKKDHALKQMRLICERYKDVIFVPGNHEFYDISIDAGLDLLREWDSQIKNWHFLDAYKTIYISGQSFKGATMWQPSPNQGEYTQKISDHYYIKDFTKEAPKHYRRLTDFLDSSLQPTDIVVTHHAPSTKSISPEFSGSPANHWFITPELESVIQKKQPLMWIHGHVHSVWDYKISTTRILCNPRGYPGEGVRFNPKLVVNT